MSYLHPNGDETELCVHLGPALMMRGIALADLALLSEEGGADALGLPQGLLDEAQLAALRALTALRIKVYSDDEPAAAGELEQGQAIAARALLAGWVTAIREARAQLVLDRLKTRSTA